MAHDSPPELKPLIDAAKAARRRSYAPYSGYQVGAALLLASGETVTAANVENASYGLTICAERAAMAAANALRDGPPRIKAAAIAGPDGAASPPCGACRQVLAEFSDADTVIAFPERDETIVATLLDLLPFGFELEA